MSRIFVDITELSNWQGRLTGVPRVMDELSSRFAQSPDHIFVAWDGVLGEYRKLDFASAVVEKSGKLQLTMLSSFSTRLSRVTLATRKLKKESRIAKEALRVSARAVRKIGATDPAPVIGNEQVSKPQKGDTLFLLADWHGSDEAFVRYLINLKKVGVRLAQMSYDLLPIVTPQYSGHATASLTHYTKQIYPICNVIFAISEHTKQDVVDWLKQNNLQVPKIEVIRLGDDFKLSKPYKPADFRLEAGFLLCVGTIEARKNHTLLYYVYKLAHQRGIRLPNLVIVGRRGWKSEDIYEIITSDPETKDRFVILDSASDEELSWLYQNCLFSIYPSFYEGWGLPIAESIAYGAPCICSNTSSMPEVAGDLVGYFSPFSADECLRALMDMLKPGAIDRARRKVVEYRPTSWDQTFSSVNKAIEEIHD